MSENSPSAPAPTDHPAPDWRALALAVLCDQQSRCGVAVFDADLNVLTCNARLSEMTASLGPGLIAWFGISAGAVEDVLHRAWAAGGEIEQDISTPNGSALRLRARPLRDDAQFKPVAMALIVSETASHIAGGGASEAERLLRQILDSMAVMAFILDREGVLMRANAPALAAGNLQPSDVIGAPLVGSYWWNWSAESQARLASAIKEAQAGRVSEYRERIRVASDIFLTIMLKLAPLHDADGAVTHLVLTGVDVSELVETQERQELLAAELTHRAKNILAIVKALVTRSARRATTKEALATSLEGRITAMAAAITQLSRMQWAGSDLREAIGEQLASYGQDRVTLEGGPYDLGPKATMALALITYELASNATKYGALSTADGHIAVRWEPQGQHLNLEWREIGGPPVTTPTEFGFGSTLVKNLAEGDLGAKAEMDYAADGLIMRMAIPLQRLAQRAEAHESFALEPSAPASPFAGRRILVAEDAPVIALDLKGMLEEAGIIVLGPYATMTDARKAAIEESYDLALLDIDLRGETSLPVAAEAAKRGRPILFATAESNDANTRAAFPDAPVIAKPYSETEMFDAIEGLIAPGAA